MDTALRAAIDEHQAVLAAGPSDVAALLAEASAKLGAGDKQIAQLRDRLEWAQREAAEVGPLAALRRENRQRRDRSAGAAGRLRQELADTERAQAQRGRGGDRAAARRSCPPRAWQAREEWRAERIDSLRDQLDHHWAPVVLGAVNQGDPLAYGVDRLRRAHATVATDLTRLEASLPPDRRDQLDHAEFMLRQLHGKLGWAVKGRDTAATELTEASRRRFGRRDPTSIAGARVRLSSEQGTIDRLEEAIAETRATIAAERAAIDARARAQAASADQRRVLTRNIETIAQALDVTRVERVAAAANAHPDGQRLRDLLGEPPVSPAGRAAWRQIAERVEHALDDPDHLARCSWSPDPLDRLVVQLAARTPHAHKQALSIMETATHAVQIAHAGRDGASRTGPARPTLSSPIGDHGLDLGL